MEVLEKDWKLYRKMIGGWQEAYMQRLDHEYIKILTSDSSASEKFWKIEKRVNQDKQSPGVIARMSRGTMFQNVVAMLNDGVITEADLENFSEGFRETVRMLSSTE